MEPFDSRQLKAFRELARQRSFTEAAKRLRLTQSAVSHSIKALEGAIGCKLFDRHGKNVKLTQAGEVFLPHVDRILSGMQRAYEEVIQVQSPDHGRMRIGATITISQYALPSVLREIRESFPHYEFSLVTHDTHRLLELLDQGDLDVVLGLESPAGRSFEFHPLFQDHIGFALSPVHPMAEKQRLTAEALARQSFIFYQNHSETYRLVAQRFRELGIELKAPFEVGSVAAIKEMAKIGVGIGLIAPWVALPELEARTLVYRPLPRNPIRRTWGLYHEARRDLGMVESVFAGVCKSVVENLLRRESRVLEAA